MFEISEINLILYTTKTASVATANYNDNSSHKKPYQEI